MWQVWLARGKWSAKRWKIRCQSWKQHGIPVFLTAPVLGRVGLGRLYLSRMRCLRQPSSSLWDHLSWIVSGLGPSTWRSTWATGESGYCWLSHGALTSKRSCPRQWLMVLESPISTKVRFLSGSEEVCLCGSQVDLKTHILDQSSLKPVANDFMLNHVWSLPSKTLRWFGSSSEHFSSLRFHINLTQHIEQMKNSTRSKLRSLNPTTSGHWKFRN